VVVGYLETHVDVVVVEERRFDSITLSLSVCTVEKAHREIDTYECRSYGWACATPTISQFSQLREYSFFLLFRLSLSL